jgi:hypothetical protein
MRMHGSSTRSPTRCDLHALCRACGIPGNQRLSSVGRVRPPREDAAFPGGRTPRLPVPRVGGMGGLASWDSFFGRHLMQGRTAGPAADRRPQTADRRPQTADRRRCRPRRPLVEDRHGSSRWRRPAAARPTRSRWYRPSATYRPIGAAGLEMTTAGTTGPLGRSGLHTRPRPAARSVRPVGRHPPRRRRTPAVSRSGPPAPSCRPSPNR